MPQAQARLIWSAGALDDLLRLRRFILPANPAAARRAARAIQEAARTLRRFPRKGRALAGSDDLRELVIPFGGRSYVLRYLLQGDEVIVLQVWHARESRE